MNKRIVILGSTGSIGRQTLEVIEAHRESFTVVGLAARSSVDAILSQARRHQPEVVALADEAAAHCAAVALAGSGIQVLAGDQGLCELAAREDADLVVSALVGAAGLLPTLAAVERGVDVAFVNKETLVVAGEVVTSATRRSGATLIPVDSEHSALFQCLVGEQPEAVERLVLTCSGGPFWQWSPEQMKSATAADAMSHPTWDMGPKVTIDSATQMNKGLEVIEARWLFDVPVEKVEIVIHPQSIVHSMVVFVDGSIKAQLGLPDMRAPIQFALTHPQRLPSPCRELAPAELGALTFEPPDEQRFPCLRLCREAAIAGGDMPIVLNAANEVAVAALLDGRLRFDAIAGVIEETMQQHDNRRAATLDEILDVDRRARRAAGLLVERDADGGSRR